MRPVTYGTFRERNLSKIAPGSLRASIFTLTSSAVGAGCLTLPLVMKNTGFAIGIMLIACGAVLAKASMDMLVESANLVLHTRRMESGRRSISYSELVAILLGREWGIALEITLALYCFGCIVGLLLVIGKAIGFVCDAFQYEVGDRDLHIVAAAALSFPLSLLRNISSLALTSLLGVFAMSFVCFSITFRAMQNGAFKDLTVPLAQVKANFCSSACIVFYTYNCHVNIFSIYGSLRYPLLRRIKTVTRRSVAVEFILYTCVATAGFLLFHEHTKGNILLNFPVKDTLIAICQAAVACALTVSLPLSMHPCRENLFLLVAKTPCDNSSEKEVAEYDLRKSDSNFSLPSSRALSESEAKMEYGSVPPNSAPSRRGGSGGNINVSRSREKIVRLPLPKLHDKKEENTEEPTVRPPAMTSHPLAAQMPILLHILMTIGIQAAALYLALNVPGIQVVFGFLGATAASLTSFILPFLMYMRVLDIRRKKDRLDASSVAWKKAGLWVTLTTLSSISFVAIMDSVIAMYGTPVHTSS